MDRVRIRDIADELGLSTATVSNVIHGKTKKISDATARRVQATLEQRGYIPSMAGILLAQNDSRIIGVFIIDHEKYEGHTLDDVFIAAALNALSCELEAHDRFMMVKKAKRADEIMQFASMWNMDGLVVIGFCAQDYSYLREHVRVPFVVYDGFCEKAERIANITLDNFGGGQQVGALFRRLGHRRALCLSDNLVGVDQERIEGFCAGFGASAVDTVCVPMHREERREFYRASLSRLRRATAAFAVSDYYAIDFMHFLQENGLTVPRDMSIAGFDDIPLCTMVYPALTSVHQDCARRAKLAVEKLEALRRGNCEETTLTLDVMLVERGSTSPPPAE